MATLDLIPNSVRHILATLLAASLSATLLRGVRSIVQLISSRIVGLRLSNALLTHLPGMFVKAMLPWAALTNPATSTFRPHAILDLQWLRSVVTPSSPVTIQQEECTSEPCFAESFGFFTLAAIPNLEPPVAVPTESLTQQELVTSNDSVKHLEAVLAFVNNANPRRLYYIGAFDRWVCVNVVLALSTLHVLNVFVNADILRKKIQLQWTVWSHGSSIAEPPPDYIPAKAEDPDCQCVICMDSRKDTVFRPCGHLSVCWSCGQNLQGKCPVCRGKVTAAEYVGRIFH
jgi:hypothetical protein